MSGRAILVALLIAAVAAPTASAQQDGVFVDPDSPAGSEYAVPLDQARRDATGGDGSATPSGEDEPLFGVGIEPSGAGGAGGAEKSDGAKPGSQPGDGGGGAATSGEIAPSGQDAAAIEAAASDGSAGLATAGIAAAVLMAGLLGGLGLRRLLRGD